MTAKKSRKNKEVHAPTVEDPTPCKPACQTCGLYLSIEKIQEMLGSEADPDSVLSIMRETIKPADWKAIIKKQLALAREGNKGAFEALMEYTVGRPTAMETPVLKKGGAAEFFFTLLMANRDEVDEGEEMKDEGGGMKDEG